MYASLYRDPSPFLICFALTFFSIFLPCSNFVDPTKDCTRLVQSSIQQCHTNFVEISYLCTVFFFSKPSSHITLTPTVSQVLLHEINTTLGAEGGSMLLHDVRASHPKMLLRADAFMGFLSLWVFSLQRWRVASNNSVITTWPLACVFLLNVCGVIHWMCFVLLTKRTQFDTWLPWLVLKHFPNPCRLHCSVVYASVTSNWHPPTWSKAVIKTCWLWLNVYSPNGVRRPRQIHGPKIRANVPPKGPCWRHRVCHLGAIVVAWAARWRLGVGRI